MSFVNNLFLCSIYRRPDAILSETFPWTLQLFRDLKRLEFRSRVTFLVGENGSGKSTLLEGLAVGAKSVAAGRDQMDRDETLWAAHEFARAFRFVRRRQPKRTMFMRAEDVLGYTLTAAKQRNDADIAFAGGIKALEAAREAEEREEAADISKPTIDQAAERLRRRLGRKYGSDPVNRSHGETFLELLGERLLPNGLYFLDEPETPLSPNRVLGLLALLKDRATSGCQFIVATHSPILMALPDSQILLLEEGTAKPIPYEDVEHVRLTKAFLSDPQRFLRHL
ncbi:MAG: AAA family ATPase [Candidatus Binataceae bacterium]